MTDTYPEPDEWVDEPPAGTTRAIDEALADVEAGRTTVYGSTEEFLGHLEAVEAEGSSA